LVKPYTSGLDRIKHVSGLFIILILTCFLITDESVSIVKALQVVTPTLTEVNPTSFKGTTANASAVQSGTVPSHTIISASFKVVSITKVAKLPHIGLSSYTVTNVGGKLPQRILEANSSLNYKLSHIQPSKSKILLSLDPSS
jgi:hypothetical protein